MKNKKRKTQNRDSTERTARSESIRILHVDDSPDFVEMASEFLHRTGDELEVETRTDPIEAVAVVQNKEFDCVVSDCSMPGMEIDGIEFRSEVRSKFPDLPFVFFTGTPYQKFPEDVTSDDSTTHLKKEIDIEKFTQLSEHIRDVVTVGRDRR